MKNKCLSYVVMFVLSFVLVLGGVGIQARDSGDLNSNPLLPASVKSETVYVSLSHEGKVDRMSVVNFFNEGSQEISDYGVYKEMVNLSNKTEPSVQGDYIRFILNQEERSQPFFYEGVMESVALPWNIRITYLLDGEPMGAKKLAGRSGDLTMNIHIQQNNDALAWFGERYLLQIQVPLWLDKVSSIYAPQASRMIAGSSNYLSFIFLPQESQSFVVQAVVQDFEMEAIEIVALQMNPDSISMNGFGLSDIEQLLDGLKEMTQATGSINEGAVQFEGGLREFDGRLSSMGIHGGAMARGLAEFEANLSLMVENVPEFREGSSQVYEGLTELHQGSQMLHGGYVEIAGGVKKMLEPKDKLRAIAGKYLMSPSEDIQTMAFAIAGMLNGLEKLDEGMQGINGHFGEFSEGLGALTDGYGMMDEGIAELAENVPVMTREVKPLFDGINGLLGGLLPLSEGFSDLFLGYQPLPEGLGALHDGQKLLMSELSLAETWMDRMAGSAGNRKVVSFASPEKNQVDSVQFIMRTPEISKIAEQKDAVEKTASRNFWQRLMDLFSW